jgi:tetratricopeptide (TPR) repeat protein
VSRIDVHPDDLLERADLEGLGEADERRLREHLERCEACSIERSLRGDFAKEREVRDADVAIAEAALARLSQAASRRTAPIAWRWAVAVAVALVACSALGAYLAGSTSTPETSRSAPVPVPAPAPGPAPEELASPPPAASPETEPDPTVTPAPAEPARARARTARSATDDGAADLFRRANAARRGGDFAEAARLYRELQERFPGAREEVLSRVSLGHLLLTRLGDAGGALPLFDSYLAAEPEGPMREEARVGRALCLQRLGRHREEQEAWEVLLREHPESVHVERARRRLDELL